MTEKSIHHLLEQVNDTGAEYPRDRSLAELIVEQCAKTPRLALRRSVTTSR